jgi:ATP-dependent protease ClpP protease subunit
MQSTDTLANDIGTILVGEDAVSCGLIDRVGSLSQALDCLKELIRQEEKPCSTL